MTIRPGSPWGEVVACPPGLITVADDAALAWYLDANVDAALRVTGGDLARTVGGPSTGPECRRYPIDGLRVVLDGDDAHAHLAVAHVVVRRPGPLGWWRGEIWAAMNVSRLGEWDVAPRAHPNDGRIDVVAVDAGLSVRARWHARRRLPTGAHVPHPAISLTRPSTATWRGAPAAVYVDGVRVAQARSVDVTVDPDLAVIHV